MAMLLERPPEPVAERAPVRAALELRLPSAAALGTFLAVVILSLVALSVFGQTAKYVFGRTQIFGLVPLFYLDAEQSVPTWYSSAALGFAALLLVLCALADRGSRGGRPITWAGLALLFGLLSIDEIAGIHEMPIDRMREAYGLGGPLYYGWVIPGGLFVLALAVCLFGFIRSLPGRTRLLFILAAGVFLTGALGVEMVSGWWADPHGEDNLVYALIISVEECCEMLGVAIFIYALYQRLLGQVRELRLTTAAAG